MVYPESFREYREALAKIGFSILGFNFLSQITTQLELTKNSSDVLQHQCKKVNKEIRKNYFRCCLETIAFSIRATLSSRRFSMCSLQKRSTFQFCNSR